MKRDKIQLVLLLSVIAIIVLDANSGGNLNREFPSIHEKVLNNLNSPLKAYNHDPIYIDGNAMLATFIGTEGLSGDGTYVSPYIIEDFIIDASTAHGIEIKNTDSYLIVRNCSVSGGASSENEGIVIYNVSNINLSNNDFTTNAVGIQLSLSSNFSLSGNDASFNSGSGIYLFMSSNYNLSNNNARYNGFVGIFLINSINIIVLGNKAENNKLYGIVLISPINCTLSGNLVKGAGFQVYGTTIDTHIDTTNKVNNKSLRYYEGIPDVHLSWESDVGQVILVDCNDSVIEGLTISDTNFGITLINSDNCLISDNTLNDCFYYGFYVSSSNNNIFTGNMMNRAGLGIRSSYNNSVDTSNKVNNKSLRYYEDIRDVNLSWESDVGQVILINCTNSVIEGLSIEEAFVAIHIEDTNICSISENTLCGSYYGIYLDNSRFCTFSGNIVFENEFGFYLSRINNSTVSGNIVYNNEIGIDLSGSDNEIYSNDIYGNQDLQAEEGMGSTDNQWDNGTTGNYWGNDYLGKYPEATNDGTVWDTPYEIDGDSLGTDNFPLVNPIFPDGDAPIFSFIPEDFTAAEGYSGLNVSWKVLDLQPATYAIEMDGAEVVAATTWSNGIAISYDILNGLSEDIYNITVFVSDESGNIAQDTVILTISKTFDIPDFLTNPVFYGVAGGSLITIIIVTIIAIRIMSDRSEKSKIRDLNYDKNK
ncbi:MAG: NosD domain-containing protein [Promethearchaeota archaeon]